MTIEQEWQQIREVIRAHIARHGRSIQAVGEDESDVPGTQPFSYTVGNHALGLPELLVVGTTKLSSILNVLSDIQRDRGKAFGHEELVSIGGKFPLRIVDAGELGRRQYASFACIYYNSDTVEVLQVLIPDAKGRWPDTPGCDPPYRDQPILAATSSAS